MRWPDSLNIGNSLGGLDSSSVYLPDTLAPKMVKVWEHEDRKCFLTRCLQGHIGRFGQVLVIHWQCHPLLGHYYHPCMQVGNVFGHVYVCVCVSVCLSVCVSVCSGYNFWTAWHRNFIFWYAGTSWPYLGQVWVSRSLDQGQGHMRKKDCFTYFNFLILCMWLQVIKRFKVTHQGQSKISPSLPTICNSLLILTY